MERRSSERLIVKIDAICEYKSFTFFVTINNCSDEGMCISTKRGAPPLKENNNLIIPLKEETVKLSAKLCWSIKTKDYNYTAGLKLLNPPQNYLELLNRFR